MTIQDPTRPHRDSSSPDAAPGMPEVDCDLVMKGGITSGVIFPRLIAKLSKRYRFRNIGGTSAGAIAAAGCAAAEFRRAQGSNQGFVDLANLPAELNDKKNPTRRTKLFTLFQPIPALRRHFAALQAALNKKPAAAAVEILIAMLSMQAGLVVLGLLTGGTLLAPFFFAVAPAPDPLHCVVYGVTCMAITAVCAIRTLTDLATNQAGTAAIWALLVPLVPVAMLAWSSVGTVSLGVVAVAVCVVIVSLLVVVLLALAVAARFAKGLFAGLHTNGYGCCSGQTPPDGSKERLPALTDWLTGYFNKLAGLPEDGDPLTFGHLWGTDDPNAPRCINLEVMTSAVSQQMIYSIPFRDGTPTFYYDASEWGRYFPDTVMDWLADAIKRNPGGDSGKPPVDGVVIRNAKGSQLTPLPRRADLPLVVAVRMSLSFPVLLSAVPLYSIDWSLECNQRRRDEVDRQVKAGLPVDTTLVATRVWFSDGGIGSNMPLHMFDSLLPGHPTFAVNLKAPHPDFDIKSPEVADNDGGRIYLPTNNQGGGLRHWPEPDDAKPLGGLVGFLWGIINTMQNWRDEIQFPYPGFRDRIVQVSQRSDEGGLNLDMPQESITALANAGEMAADRLIARFHPEGVEQGRGWVNHQTIRLRTFLGAVQPATAGLVGTLADGPWKGYVEKLDAYEGTRRALATNFLSGLAPLAALGKNEPSLEGAALKPLAQIRITPRI